MAHSPYPWCTVRTSLYSQGGSPSPSGGGGTGVGAAVGATVGAGVVGWLGVGVGLGVDVGVDVGVAVGVGVADLVGVGESLTEGTTGAGGGPPIGLSSAGRMVTARKETLRTTPSTAATAGEIAPWSWTGGVRGKAMRPDSVLVAPTTTDVHRQRDSDVRPPRTAGAHRRYGA